MVLIHGSQRLVAGGTIELTLTGLNSAVHTQSVVRCFQFLGIGRLAAHEANILISAPSASSIQSVVVFIEFDVSVDSVNSHVVWLRLSQPRHALAIQPLSLSLCLGRHGEVNTSAVHHVVLKGADISIT